MHITIYGDSVLMRFLRIFAPGLSGNLTDIRQIIEREFDEKNVVNFRELPLLEDSFYESGSKFSPIEGRI